MRIAKSPGDKGPFWFERAPVWAPMELLRRDLERLTEGWSEAAPAARYGRLAPSLDVVEEDGQIRVAVDLPGIDPADVEVTLEGAVLSIKGERKAQRDEKKGDIQVSERVYGAFERQISVPDGIDPATVRADYVQGVLTIVLPKPKDAMAQRRRIEIRAAAADGAPSPAEQPPGAA